MYMIQFIRGFCMALADSVPGVSGGTIAFLLGFYDQFIGSIDDLLLCFSYLSLASDGRAGWYWRSSY